MARFCARLYLHRREIMDAMCCGFAYSDRLGFPPMKKEGGNIFALTGRQLLYLLYIPGRSNLGLAGSAQRTLSWFYSSSYWDDKVISLPVTINLLVCSPSSSSSRYFSPDRGSNIDSVCVALLNAVFMPSQTIARGRLQLSKTLVNIYWVEKKLLYK